jgi:hypothetical protein
MQFKICPVCRRLDALDAQQCVQCGHLYRTRFPPPAPPDPTQMYAGQPPSNVIQMPAGKHRIVLAVLVTIVFGGWAGCLVNRQYLKGIRLLVVGVIFAAFTAGWGLVIWVPMLGIDACSIAWRLRRGEPVGHWQFF